MAASGLPEEVMNWTPEIAIKITVKKPPMPIATGKILVTKSPTRVDPEPKLTPVGLSGSTGSILLPPPPPPPGSTPLPGPQVLLPSGNVTGSSPGSQGKNAKTAGTYEIKKIATMKIKIIRLQIIT